MLYKKMKPHPYIHKRILFGIFLISASVLMLEISLIKIFSFIYTYHFAFFDCKYRPFWVCRCRHILRSLQAQDTCIFIRILTWNFYHFWIPRGKYDSV